MATHVVQLDADDLRQILREELSSLLDNQKNDKRFLRVPEAAAMLGISDWALRALERRGEVPCHRVGSRLFFDPDELTRFVKGQA